MPIQISKNLSAAPNPTTLPKRIELSQTLRSRLPNEAITVVYSLAADHNVFFKDGDGAPAKSFTRQENVGTADKTCVDRVTLVEKPGTAMALVTVFQTITDSDGIVLGDQVIVRISR
jgi:hypothetical protein